MYTLPSGYLAVTGDPITATQHNSPMEDIATALTGSLPRAGTAGMLANLPMGGFKITGAAAATADGQVLIWDQIGTDVQAYDADTAKLDVAQTWTAVQTFDGSNGLRTKSASVGTGPSYVRFEDSAATSLGSVGAGSGLTDDISLNATSGDLLLNCASGAAFLNSNPIASVYTGSSASNTDFPIGTIISIDINGYTTGGSTMVGSVPNRAASVSPMVPDYGGGALGGWGPKQFQITGDGTLLSGTWRSRGSIPDRNFLAERVA